MNITGLTKLIVCVLVIIAASVLGVTKSISSEATVALLTGALGYVFGNGHGILSAQKTQRRVKEVE